MHIHSGIALDAVGALIDDIGPKIHAAEIDAVNAKVQKRTAAKVRAKDSLLELHHVAKAGVKKTWLADGTAVKQFLYFQGQRHVSGPDGLGDEDSFLVRKVEQGIGLTGIGGEGFLAENGLAGVDGQAGVFKVV